MSRTAVLLAVSLAACAHAKTTSTTYPPAARVDGGSLVMTQADACCSPCSPASRALLPFMQSGESDDAELRLRVGELAGQEPNDQRLASLSGPFPATRDIDQATPNTRRIASEVVAQCTTTDAYGCAPCYP